MQRHLPDLFDVSKDVNNRVELFFGFLVNFCELTDMGLIDLVPYCRSRGIKAPLILNLMDTEFLIVNAIGVAEGLNR
jgi:hypothetical protein